jgi:hypothetical protein
MRRVDVDEDAPTLDLDALLSLDLRHVEAEAVLGGSSCVSERELADRLEMLLQEGRGARLDRQAQQDDERPLPDRNPAPVG